MCDGLFINSFYSTILRMRLLGDFSILSMSIDEFVVHFVTEFAFLDYSF